MGTLVTQMPGGRAHEYSRRLLTPHQVAGILGEVGSSQQSRNIRIVFGPTAPPGSWPRGKRGHTRSDWAWLVGTAELAWAEGSRLRSVRTAWPVHCRPPPRGLQFLRSSVGHSNGLSFRSGTGTIPTEADVHSPVQSIM